MTEPDLLVEFNSFLPPGYGYGIQGDGSITLCTPSSQKILMGPWILQMDGITNNESHDKMAMEDDQDTPVEGPVPGRYLTIFHLRRSPLVLN
jgi:histone deacetylase complex regulatory component SIN3